MRQPGFNNRPHRGRNLRSAQKMAAIVAPDMKNDTLIPMGQSIERLVGPRKLGVRSSKARRLTVYR